MPGKGALWRWVLGAAAGGALVALVFLPATGSGIDGGQPARPAPARPAAPPAQPDGPQAVPAAGERAAQLRQLTEHFEQVDQTLCSYLASTRYPLSSRPMSEHPDQAYPNRPVVETNAMRGEGGRGADANVLIQTSQSRVFMVAGEAVALSLRAIDPKGTAQPLVVTGAVARGLVFGAARPGPAVALAFADDGRGADPVAGDSHFAAVLAPAQSSLAQFNGTIRTEVRYSVNGRAGLVLFDVIYSPEVPAVWTGQAREVIEGGSLAWVLKADVRQAGRYIVTGRVDDAAGKPFALATFNEVLRAGPNDIRLTVFGKLLHDKSPAMPLTLRDVDAYLLKEDTDPDRALMPRLEGRVVAGRPHALSSFSDAEWDGEERRRHVAEFSKDVELAQKELAAFDPARPVPKSRCARR